MTRWIKNRLSNIFTPKARPAATRFRPSMIALEDRTVPAGADMFANATVIPGSAQFYSDISDNTGATGETDEDLLSHASGELNSLWWQWTPTVSGQYEINTFGSFVDTVTGLYTGTTIGDLVEVAWNDDDPQGTGTQSRIVFSANAGTTYFFGIDGFGTPENDIFAIGEIYFNLGGIPVNDDFANATVVTGGTVTGSNVQATAEIDEPEHGSNDPVVTPLPLNSVWWSWTPTTTENVTISTAGSVLDTILAVYTGTALDNLQLVASNDDVDFQNGDLTSSVTFLGVANATYYIAVEGTLHHTGEISLNIPGGAVNQPPVVDDQTFSVDENSGNGTVVGTVVANDPDAGDILTYSITGGTGEGVFAINSASGEITVANSAALNFETTSSFSLTVLVEDDGTPVGSDFATITINLNDVNEAPVFGADPTFGLDENSANGTSVGTVTATDVDAGQTLTYSILSGNTNGAFAIDASTGQITVANSAALDFETNATFVLNVVVTDSGTGNLTDTSVVTINLNDLNEQTPAQLFLDLNDLVVALRTSGDLTNPQANKLLKDLEAAERQYNKGNFAQAENQLQMFVNQVNVYVNSGILTSDDAAPLLQKAQDLLNLIP